MVRIIKKPEERKNEILDVAEALFHTQGYEGTSTGDILQKAGIARGTLYYHFKTKEEIMNAVISRRIERQVQRLMPIVEDSKLNALEKIEQVILKNQELNSEHIEIKEFLHQPENSVMHQKSLIQSVNIFAPLFATLIRQGIREKLFETEYPLELAEFIMIEMNFLFDQSIFPRSQAEVISRMKALVDILERSLRAKKGSLDFLLKII